jgi:hypothetical protein
VIWEAVREDTPAAKSSSAVRTSWKSMNNRCNDMEFGLELTLIN